MKYILLLETEEKHKELDPEDIENLSIEEDPEDISPEFTKKPQKDEDLIKKYKQNFNKKDNELAIAIETWELAPKEDDFNVIEEEIPEEKIDNVEVFYELWDFIAAQLRTKFNAYNQLCKQTERDPDKIKEYIEEQIDRDDFGAINYWKQIVENEEDIDQEIEEIMEWDVAEGEDLKEIIETETLSIIEKYAKEIGKPEPEPEPEPEPKEEPKIDYEPEEEIETPESKEYEEEGLKEDPRHYKEPIMKGYKIPEEAPGEEFESKENKGNTINEEIEKIAKEMK